MLLQNNCIVLFTIFFSCWQIRILALTPILTSSCDNQSDIREVEFNSDLGSDYYINPIAILLCYYVVALSSNVLLRTMVIFSFLIFMLYCEGLKFKGLKRLKNKLSVTNFKVFY